MTGDPKLRRLGFAALLLAQILFYGWLALAQRIPWGHDTLSVLQLQYLFLSQPGSGAGVALWIPQLAHGMTSAWFAGIQNGLLQNLLLLFGGVPEGTPMLPVFYAGMFLEDLLLLIGVWKLSARLYRSPAAQFFVAAAAVGSSMWISNIFWSHRLIYGIPLATALLLDFLESGRRTRLLAAASLGGLLLLGNPPYIPVLSSLIVAAFLALYVGLHRKRLRLSLPLLRPRPADALWLAAIVLVLAVSVLAVVTDLGAIRQYQRARNPDGSVSLDTFLTFPGGLNPLRYLDVALGFNISTDFSVYAGLGTLLMAVLGFTRRPRKDLLIVAVLLVFVLLFSTGYLSCAGMLGYETVLPLRYFRYVGLSCVLVKLFLLLLAGFGVDALARGARKAAPGLVLAGLLAAQLVFRMVREGGGDATSIFLLRLLGNLVPRYPAATPGSGWALLLVPVAVAAVYGVWRVRQRSFPLLIPLILVLHGIDLFGWRVQLFREATRPLQLYPRQRSVLNVEPIPYAARRTPTDVGSRRADDFGRDYLRYNDERCGTLYDYSDAFLHRDASWSSYFVTQWSPSIDLLLRARAGMPLALDREPPPPFLVADPTPRTAPEGFARLIGETEDKLQVFSTAHPARSDEEIAGILQRTDFRGATLHLSPDAQDAPSSPDPAMAARDERVPAATKVVDFGADRIRIEVEIPVDRGPAWLMIADCWHPGWRATVDGIATPVRRANLAYKAVPLHGGRTVVEFRFHAPLRSACYLLIGLQSLAWTLGLIAASLRLLGIPLPRLPGRAP